jgi:hypothetical protein
MILTNFKFSENFSLNLQHDFIKSYPVGSEVFHADGQTDMAKLILTAFEIVLQIFLAKTSCINKG